MIATRYALNIDAQQRIVEIVKSEGLALPKKMQIPFAVIKQAAGAIIINEAQIEESARVTAGAPNLQLTE